jgi:hypothetical protein
MDAAQGLRRGTGVDDVCKPLRRGEARSAAGGAFEALVRQRVRPELLTATVGSGGAGFAAPRTHCGAQLRAV